MASVENLSLLTTCSKIGKLYRSTGYVFRWFQNAKRERTKRLYGAPYPDEISYVQVFWIKRIQSECFELELVAL